MGPCELAKDITKAPLILSCRKKEERCGYHSKDVQFHSTEILPKGLCPEAFHNLYYSSLGPLFRAKLPTEQTLIKCPGVENYVVYKASIEKLNLRFRFVNFIKRLLFCFYPGQIYTGRLVWTVVEVKGDCPLNQKTGEGFFINRGNIHITDNLSFPMGEPSTLCPAAFDNFFPYFYGFKKEKRFPFSSNASKLIQSPNKTLFEIEED